MYPPESLLGVKGKDVLCLASGGGQQSAVFGLLGANVTVVDLSQGQLDGDKTAAKHYGYSIQTVQADMRDLSCLSSDSFDLVHQMGKQFLNYCGHGLNRQSNLPAKHVHAISRCNWLARGWFRST